MNKLEETNLMIDYLTKLDKSGIKIDNTVILADIAKSLAMIANKLCGADWNCKDCPNWVEDKEVDNGNDD